MGAVERCGKVEDVLASFNSRRSENGRCDSRVFWMERYADVCGDAGVNRFACAKSVERAEGR